LFVRRAALGGGAELMEPNAHGAREEEQERGIAIARGTSMIAKAGTVCLQE